MRSFSIKITTIKTTEKAVLIHILVSADFNLYLTDF